jgi:hypothetical protein
LYFAEKESMHVQRRLDREMKDLRRRVLEKFKIVGNEKRMLYEDKMVKV